MINVTDKGRALGNTSDEPGYLHFAECQYQFERITSKAEKQSERGLAVGATFEYSSEESKERNQRNAKGLALIYVDGPSGSYVFSWEGTNKAGKYSEALAKIVRDSAGLMISCAAALAVGALHFAARSPVQKHRIEYGLVNFIRVLICRQ